MKSFLTLLLVIVAISCNTTTKQDESSSNDTTITKNETVKITKELTEAQKIANAYGYKHWDSIRELSFTFNVDRNGNHFERSWYWNRDKDEVTLLSQKDTLTYNRSKVDSSSQKTDQAFVNDIYWLLTPFNIATDEGTTVNYTTQKIAPIGKDTLNQLTLTYANESGGYTPGDAYDFYYTNDYQIKEWVYRAKNGTQASMITTWENEQDYEGITIPTVHQNEDKTFQLYFTNISLKK
ncbi:hypothetical protein ACE939_10020 [Aquimarina sp. W85]|uniref:hypothetical protein n=1 Tax=Aquimarina rhodophyticola TaxID=3342246 RepID=UPI00366BC9DF